MRILKIIPFFVFLFVVGCKSKQKVASSEAPKEETELEYKAKRQAETLFLSGMKYYMLEDFEKAMSYFKKSHAIHPNSAGTNFQIAQIYLGSGFPKEALPYCEKAFLLNDENIYYYQLLAQCYTQLGENSTVEKERKAYLKQAANTYEALVKKYPSEDDVYFDLANLYLQQGDVERGIKSINKIEEKYGVSEEISKQKQQIYLHTNQLDKAIEEGKKLIDAFPNKTKYKVDLAKLYFSNDKIPQARTILEDLQKEQKLDGAGKVMLSDIYWADGNKEESAEMLKSAFNDPEYKVEQKVNIAVGFVNSNSKRLSDDDLEEMCKSLIEMHPEEPKVYVVYGDFLLKNEKKKEGRSQYLKALSIDDSYFQVWQNVIILDSDLLDNDSIIKHTNKALEIYPNQGVFWYYNASAYLSKKEYKKAIYSFEKAKKLTNNNNTLQLIILAQLGDTYNGLEEYEKSDASYEEVLAIDPNNVHVLNNYSYFLSLRKEKLDVATEMCEKLMKLEPNNPTYLDTYAWVLYQKKDYQKAKELLAKALENSKDGTIVEHYGDALYQLGDKEKALEQWQKAKETGDHSDLIDKKIKDKKLYE